MPLFATGSLAHTGKHIPGINTANNSARDKHLFFIVIFISGC
jgi:hypothetical protein